MNQPPDPNPPGYPPPGGYAPPPPYSPPPAYGQPPGYSPGPPPSRSGPPWWVWVLGGCGGCLLIALVVVVISVNWLGNTVKSVMNVPVTPQTVRQELGPDVPIYPNATLDVSATKAMLITMRTMEKAAGQKDGAFVRGVGMFDTDASPTKVREFYDRQLAASGWKRAPDSSEGSDDFDYQKGEERLSVQVEGSGDSTTITLMRGGKEMNRLMRSGGE